MSSPEVKSFVVWAQTWGVALLLAVLCATIITVRLVRWLRIKRTWHWTRIDRQRLRLELNNLTPEQLQELNLAVKTTGASSGVQRGINIGCSLFLVVIILIGIFVVAFTEAGGRFVTNLGDWVTSMIDTGGTGQAIVSGGYEYSLGGEDLGGGAVASDQTWTYVFNEDGSYTTFLNGNQQFSGSWSQSGNQLTVIRLYSVLKRNIARFQPLSGNSLPYGSLQFPAFPPVFRNLNGTGISSTHCVRW